MKAPRKQLAAIIAEKTLHGEFDHKEITSLAAYLLDENRTGELNSLLRDVQQDWADQGIVAVVAQSAHALPQGVTGDIEAIARNKYPNAQQVMVTSLVDPALIGGIRLEFAGYQLDQSTKGKLQTLRAIALQGKD